jgi:hypothetical protein
MKDVLHLRGESQVSTPIGRQFLPDPFILRLEQNGSAKELNTRNLALLTGITNDPGP